MILVPPFHIPNPWDEFSSDSSSVDSANDPQGKANKIDNPRDIYLFGSNLHP